MKKILFLIPMPFHSKSNNAGAKVINYYINKFNLDFEVTILLCYEKNELETKLMFHEYPNLNFIYNFKSKNIFEKLFDRFYKTELYYKLLPKISPINYKTTGLINKILSKSLKNIIEPDIFDFIIVEFPTLVLQSQIIKSKFPNAILIASVHDISFQSLERYLTSYNIWVDKMYYFNKFKKFELNNLLNFDLIVVLSTKDELLIKSEIKLAKDILTITPFFEKYKYTIGNNNGIVFFGAMNRIENEKSIIWFIKNVWVNIQNKSITLYIVGGGVKPYLYNFCSNYNNIVLTGYVLDPTPIFNKCAAMIVPLQYGAGIKIKTLEALSSGIPLLSNAIGIEGIGVSNFKEFLYCETPNDWMNNIELICSNQNLCKFLSDNSKKFMLNNYKLLESYIDYKNKLYNLL